MINVTLKKPEKWSCWWRLYKLYRSAFPLSERKPFGMIRKMYRRGVTDVWCVERAGKFSGLAITINSPKLILLDFLAVCPECRGSGVGTATLAVLQKIYEGKGLFLEIESTLLDCPERELRLRRKKFYVNCGLKELGTTAKLFGVDMELLGIDCQLDYDGYRNFYREFYNSWAADHITPT